MLICIRCGEKKRRKGPQTKPIPHAYFNSPTPPKVSLEKSVLSEDILSEIRNLILSIVMANVIGTL